MPLFQLLRFGGPPIPFVEFFEALHDSDEKCVASPWQQDAFRLIGMDRAAILANDYDLIHRKGWACLIAPVITDSDDDAMFMVWLQFPGCQPFWY
jgi:hypothetical protein